ncbi:MAG: hypothetical protein IJQ49_05445 [Prevotella sp.]|nr:hypothetical protein [Prevotella sp.]
MNMKIKNILIAACLMTAANVYAQDCVMPISIQLDEDFTNVPPAASTILYQSLSRVATENGLTTESPITPFVLTVHCDVLDKSNLPGPPVQTVYNLGITFYMADTYSQKKFGTVYITLDGVGTGEVKSYINAFRRISANNSQITSLINRGKKNMLNYYDTQYPNIIKEAKRLASLHQYEEALTMVLSIPICSKGGDEASMYGLQLYTKYLDRMNLYLLNQAKALWAAGQDQQTAYDVCAMLAQIDPDAACYGEAGKLMKEVKARVRSDIDFEMREKYHDQINLEKDRIAAARAVGVAFGNGQKPTTTNLMWLR